MFKVSEKTTYVNRRTGKEVREVGDASGGCLIALGVLLLLPVIGAFLTHPTPGSPGYAEPIIVNAVLILGVILFLLGIRIKRGSPAKYIPKRNFTCLLCGKEWSS